MADSEDVFEARKKKQQARRNKHSHEQRDRKRKQAAIDKRAAKALSSNPVAEDTPEFDQMAVDEEMGDNNRDDSHVNDGDTDDDRAEDDKAGEDKADDNKAARPRSERHIRNQARLNRNRHRRRDEKKAEKRAQAAQDSQVLASSTANHQDSTQRLAQPERPLTGTLGSTIAPIAQESSSVSAVQQRGSPLNDSQSLAEIDDGKTPIDKTKKRKRLPNDIGREYEAKLARQMGQIALNSTTSSRGTQTDRIAPSFTTINRGTQTTGVGLSIRIGKPVSFIHQHTIPEETNAEAGDENRNGLL